MLGLEPKPEPEPADGATAEPDVTVRLPPAAAPDTEAEPEPAPEPEAEAEAEAEAEEAVDADELTDGACGMIDDTHRGGTAMGPCADAERPPWGAAPALATLWAADAGCC